MSLMSRVKMLLGSSEATIPTVASATSITIPQHASAVLISGSTAIVRINDLVPIQPGREITLIGATGGSATITNNNATTTKGQVDMGGSNTNVAADDVIKLIQLSTGAWRRVIATDN